MEISEIKYKLSITRVLEHYGMHADKTGRLRCPFHDDRNPSMQVYNETNTVYCFAASCRLTGKAIDAIDFIMHIETITKHKAILKAKDLIGQLPSSSLSHMHESKKEVAEKEQTIVDHGKLFRQLRTMYKKSDKAQRYMKSRSIGKTEAGYNDGTIEQLKHCVVFPLKDKDGEIVSLYGRSIHNDAEARHYYTRDRRGLYPEYPHADTQRLVITEAVIDAATLIQYTNFEVLACYGTNGLTAEHEQAIKELKQLQTIVIFFDGDEAGRQAAVKVAARLKEIKPFAVISMVNTPDGEDVNSLVQSHEPGILAHLVDQETTLFLSPEITPQPKSKTTAKLDASNPMRITYCTAWANYYVKGGLRNEADSMRVSLDIEHQKNNRKSRSKVDLYEDKQVEKVAREAAEKLQLRSDMVQLDLEMFTELLERYREDQTKPKEAIKEQPVSPQYEKQAREFLSKPDLVKRWNELIGRAGVVGEETNRMFLMAIAVTHKMNEPLHALIQGSSGSGKTHLMARIYNFIPQQDKKNFTRVTEGSLYNYGMYDLQHKLICIEDLDGMKEEAQFAFRELQSKGMIISSTSTKDDNGNISASEKTVYGPIASMSCTTKGEIYEDNMSRCFIIAVDESQEQSRKVIHYQNMKASGQIDEVKERQCTDFIQTLVALLKPYDVVNPYADKVHLPEEAHKIRRLNGLYQAFVKAITLMHQYQRQRDDRGRLISEKEDLQIAAGIMFESILLKVDELDGSLRQFYEKLKDYVKAKAGEHHLTFEFNQRDVRQTLNISRAQLQRYINDLLQLEYIRQSGGHINRGFSYKVVYWDNINALRSKVKRHLQGQLDQLELVPA